MRMLYIERSSDHDGPESCVGVPRGRSEALTGRVRAGLLSRVIPRVQGADAFNKAEGSTAGGVFASRWWALRGRRSQARTTSSMRENREIQWSPRWSLMMPRPGWFAGWQIDGWSGREGNAEAVIP